MLGPLFSKLLSSLYGGKVSSTLRGLCWMLACPGFNLRLQTADIQWLV